MDPPRDFSSIQEDIQEALLSTLKTVNRIAAEDLSFQRTANPAVGEELEEKTARILNLANGVLKSAATVCGQNAPTIEDGEDVDLSWRKIVDVVDSMLEKAATSLDEYTGVLKRKEPPTETVSNPLEQPSGRSLAAEANSYRSHLPRSPRARASIETSAIQT